MWVNNTSLVQTKNNDHLELLSVFAQSANFYRVTPKNTYNDTHLAQNNSVKDSHSCLFHDYKGMQLYFIIVTLINYIINV